MKDSKVTIGRITLSSATVLALLLVGACVGMAERYLREPLIELDPSRVRDLRETKGLNYEYDLALENRIFLTSVSSAVVAVIKPALMELGVLFLCHAVGLPLLAKLSIPLRRIRYIPNLRLPSTAVRNLRLLQRSSARSWKTLTAFYSKSSPSKVVNRMKKLLKIFSKEEASRTEEDCHPTSSM